MTDKDLYGGLIRLHILHHASEEPIFGLGIIEELRRHERTGRREPRVYEITEQGRIALVDARTKVRELFGELIEGG